MRVHLFTFLFIMAYMQYWSFINHFVFHLHGIIIRLLRHNVVHVHQLRQYCLPAPNIVHKCSHAIRAWSLIFFRICYLHSELKTNLVSQCYNLASRPFSTLSHTTAVQVPVARCSSCVNRFTLSVNVEFSWSNNKEKYQIHKCNLF